MLYHFFSEIPDRIWEFFTNLWFPSQLPVFLIGFLAYHILCNDSVKSLAKNRFWVGCLLFFLAMTLLSLLRGNSGFVPSCFFVVLTLAGIIIAISGGQLPFLVNPFICYIGKISYSCYLVHFAALGITLKLLGISTITLRLVENPGIALGRKIIQRLNSSSTNK